MANTLIHDTSTYPSQSKGARGILGSLFEQAGQRPEAIAFRDLGNGDGEVDTVSFGELAARAVTVGRQLRGATVPTDTETAVSAVLQFAPGIDYIAALFGCWWAGITAVPAYLPRSSRHSERLAAILRDCAPGFVLTAPEHVDRINKIRSSAAPNATLIALTGGDTADCSDCRGSAQAPDVGGMLPPALIQYTSGSTGSPKGVIVTHANLLHNVDAILGGLPHTPKVSVSWLPPYHDMGLISKILLPVHAGIETVLLSPFGFMQRPARWLKAISDYRGSFSGAPDSAYDLCCRRVTDADKRQLDLSCWEVAFNGSEPVRHATLQKFSKEFHCCGFHPESAWPVYGLAEATLCVTHPTARSLPRTLKRKNDGRVFVSCGVPLNGIDIKIVRPCENPGDDNRHPCNSQEEGEIWISGPSVANGYFGRANTTRRTFAARIAPSDEKTYLRSGDLGFLSKGELFVTGRLKNVLIFNGQNFHPEDIERSVEQCHPALHVGGVAAFACKDEAGREQLALAVEVPHRETHDYGSIVRAVRATVGSQFDLRVAATVCVKDWRLPRTTSGKIQRRECASQLEQGWAKALYIDDQRVHSANRITSPSAPPEILKTVCATMEDVFGITTIAADEDFFELGGHSLTATRVASRLGAALNRSIPIRLVFEAPTPNELAAAIARQCPEIEEHTAAPETDIAALTPSQRRMWFLHIADPASSAYNVGGALGVDGEFDAQTALAAFRMCIEAHPILRATYGTVNGLPVQRIAPLSSIVLTGIVRDFRGLHDATDRVHQEATQLTRQPFDLEHGPLYRLRIFQLAEDSHVLAVSFHHIVVDGWAIGILIRDLFQNYAALRESRVAEVALAGSKTTVPAVPAIPTEKIRRQLDYWKSKLQGAQDSLDLPVDHSSPPADASDGAVCRLAIPAELTAEMQRFARSHRSSRFIVMLTGFQVLLARYCNQHDFLIGVPVANRNSQETENVIASMVNTLPYRAEMSDNPSLPELLNRVRNDVLDLQDHQDAPLEHILHLLQRSGASGSSPFRVMFDYQEISLPMNGSLKFNTEDWETHRGAAQFDLSLFVTEINGEYHAALEYKPALFDPATIARMGDHLVNTLWRLVQAGNHDTVLNMPLLSSNERHQILHGSNATALALNADENLLHDFARSAAAHSNSIAVSCNDVEITYANLDATSNQIARLLQTKGIGRGDRVAVYLERSAEIVAIFMGILKAGACYVPLDPEYPASRIAMILEDAAPGATVTQVSLARNVATATTFLIDDMELRAEIAALSAAPLALDIASEDIAYIIFTSGSTGRPKGVAIPHRGLHNFLHSMAGKPGLTSGDTLLAVTTVSFDISGLEMFLPLICGARVHIATRDQVLDGCHLIETIETLDVTHFQATPATWQLLLTCGWEGKRSEGRPLKMLCGGEELPKELASKLLQRNGELWNLYGPTETTIWSTAKRVTSAECISIGKPIGNTQCYVLDENLEPVPTGVGGELFIGGNGVAAGYHNRPDLTADRFVTDPFAGNGARMYRTGDLARYDSTGELHYLGRLDHQVKIRGHRIELGEIAAALDSHSSVTRSVVTATDLPGLGKSLIAYCETPIADIDTRVLLDHVRNLLPAYMVPAAIVTMKALPQTPNGKIDRKQLPALQQASACAHYVPPKNELERRMTDIWADLLKIPRVGTTDDFFALGGHSLLAAQAFVRMKDELGIDLPLNVLFAQATVSALADRWEKGRIENDDLPKGVVKLHQPAPGSPPRPIALLWVHPLGGGGGGGLLSYREMARKLPMVRSFGIREAGEKFATLEEMAQHYAERLNDAVPEGPVALAGFCFGGNLAIEVARHMTAIGRDVENVFLLDARPVTSVRPNRRKIISALNRILKGTPKERQRLAARTLHYLQHRWNTHIVGGTAAQYVPDLEEIIDLNEYPESYRELARHHWTLLQRHSLTPYTGAAVLLRSNSEHPPDADADCGWKPFIAAMNVETIPGRHEEFLRSTEMMSEASKRIAERLAQNHPA